MSAASKSPSQFEAVRGWIGYSRSTQPPPSCIRCGEPAELRFCAANRGVAFQCTSCCSQVGKWIPHRELIDIDLNKLPRWVLR